MTSSAPSSDVPRSLSSLFRATESLRHRLESTTPTATFQNDVARLLDLYGRVGAQAVQLGLFSPNEELDDVATRHLPYLLVPYRSAEIAQRVVAGLPSDDGGGGGGASPVQARQRVIARARAGYETFLRRADDYGLLRRAGGAYARMWARYEDDPLTFSTTEVVAPSMPRAAVPPSIAAAAARRDAKIANFRAEAELKKRLQALKARRDEGRTKRRLATGRLNGGTAGDEDEDEEEGGEGKDEEQEDDDDDDDDDEVARPLFLAELALAIHASFQALETLNREAELLAMAPSAPPPSNGVGAADTRQRQRDVAVGNGGGGAGPGGYSERLDGPLASLGRGGGGGAGPILSSDGRPLRPFQLVGNRQELARGVFRPGHNLPTMSIDEYLDEERRRGGIIEGGGEKSGIPPEVDEDDVEKADQETMQQRRWDEFVEANPKGAGNTMNRG